jgi:general secretion pathway protein N
VTPFALPAALASCLALLAAAELLAPPAPPPDAPPVRIDFSAPQGSSLDAGLPGWTATILARPLFRPDRRPLAAAAAPTAPLPRLTAIVVTQAGAIAIFDGGGKPIAAAAGGEVDGYRIARIFPDRVVIDSPSGGLVLRPQFANGMPEAAAPQAALPLAGIAPGPYRPPPPVMTGKHWEDY